MYLVVSNVVKLLAVVQNLIVAMLTSQVPGGTRRLDQVRLPRKDVSLGLQLSKILAIGSQLRA